MLNKFFAGSIFVLLLPVFFSCGRKPKSGDWAVYKGSNEGLNYSALAQIDTDNVKRLKPVWEYHTGDADTVHHSQIQCNPLVIDGVLYGTSPQLKLFAIDAATGKEKWQFNPFDTISTANKALYFILNNNRGVTYWNGGEKDKRIFYVAGSAMYAINAITGKPVQEFGENGSVDLHIGLDRDVKDLFVTATSPPVIYKNLLIIGSRVDEGAQASPGHIRAYDVRTGRLKWIFHTIPHPQEAGYTSWDDPNAYKFIGGANAWSGLTLDEKRGIVFASTGSASYDFYGGKRTGDNLYANSLIALDAETGKRKWHFQYLHHDVWDRDLSSPPALITMKKDGQKIDAVALTTKTGFLYFFERENGKPVYKIEERPVPHTSELEGEKLSATQPFPTFPAPFMRQIFREQDINPFLPDSSRADIRKRLLSYKNDSMYNPISFQGTVVFPGLDGGAEWGGPTFDPETGILYINANEMSWALKAVDIRSKGNNQETFSQAGLRLYQATCMSCHGPERKGSGNFPSIVDVKKRYSDAEINRLIQTGRRMMPAFKQLSDEQREAIVSFVTENSASGAKPFKETGTKQDEHFRLPYTVKGYDKFLSKEGYPAIAPPWGTLNAYDVNAGKYLWKIPLGNDSTVKGSPTPTGMENYGASVATAGGVLFIAASKDGQFRAFNKRTGRLLWAYKLPVPGFATPAIYKAGNRQFVVIACGGGKQGIKSGDSYLAFALPE